MKRSVILLLAGAICTSGWNASSLAAGASWREAIRHNPVTSKLVKGVGSLVAGALLLGSSVPVAAVAQDVSHPYQLSQLSSALAVQDLISLHDIYQDFSYDRAADYIRLVELLDQGKVDVNASDAQGNTVLLKIVKSYPRDESRAYRLMHLLLRHGADPQVTNDAGESAYTYVAKGGDYRPEMSGFEALMVEAVHGINGKDAKGLTPLDHAWWWSSYAGDIRLAKQLVVRGADIRQTDIAQQESDAILPLGAELLDGRKFLALAAEHGGITHVVKQRGIELLVSAVRANNGDVVGVLLTYGVDPNLGLLQAAQIYGTGLEITHVTDPNAEMLTTLLTHGADVNALHPEQGVTAMHVAASTGNYLCMKILLRHDGNPNMVNNHGGTVLHVVVMRQQQQAGFEVVMRAFVMTNMLLARGVDVHKRDAYEHTAYDYVVQTYRTPPFNHEKSPLAATAAILLQAMGGTDNDGKTAKYWAEVSGSESVQELIENGGKFIAMSGNPEEVRQSEVVQELLRIRVLGTN